MMRQLSKTRALAVMAATILLAAVVVRSFAAGPLAAFEPETSTVSAGATVASVSGASGSGVVKFAAAITPSPTPVASSCPNARNTPSGPDPWGGCFPGAHNTGYPHGLAGDTRTPVTLTNYTGSCTLSTSVTIDGKTINCDIQINAPGGATVTIKNSKINGKVFHDPGYNPSSWPSITIQDTEILGGEGGNYTLRRANLTGGNHNAYCAYGGEHAAAYGEPQEHDIKFTNNVFQRGPTGKCGGITVGGSGWAITSFDSSAPGNVWSGNVWDDGRSAAINFHSETPIKYS